MRMRSTMLWASALLAISMYGCSSSSDTSPDDSEMTSDTGKQATAANDKGDKPSDSASADSKSKADETAGAAGAGGADMMADTGSAELEDPRGHCDIESGFPSDESCLQAPDPSEGFQIHVGPSDYNNPDEVAPYVLEPGGEVSLCWSFHTPNKEDTYWQTFVLSGRSGTHHIINTMYATDADDGTEFTTCRDPGTGTNSDIIGNLPGASKSYMPRGTIAPENEHIGRKVPAATFAQADMHYFNFTDKPILREFWMNVYTMPADQVEEESTQIRGMGGLKWLTSPISVGTDEVYQYSVPIDTDGRILALLGHFHSHGKRFTAYLEHDGEDQKIFEMFDYLDPKSYEYNSITKNPEMSSDESAMQPGASSGILEVKKGDVLKWECHIVNEDEPGGLRYVNEVKTGEMCNLWGESIGPKIDWVEPLF